MRKNIGASIIMLLMTLSFTTVAVGIFNEEIELKELSFSEEIEGSAYDGDLRIYVVEQVSRWDAQDGNPYKFGFLDFALDDKLSIEYLDTYTDMITWDANDAGYSNVQENNLMVIAAVFNPEIHKGYSDPPFGNAFDAFYVDAAAGATPGSTGYNTVNEDFTHTVLVEKATSSTCPYCPAMANALNSVYNSDDYPFYYVSLVTNKNQDARTYLTQTYNYKYVPTAYFDGGKKVLVGGYDEESYYRTRIESSGIRDVHELDLSLSVEWMGAGVLEIEISITNNEEMPNNSPVIPIINGSTNGTAGKEYDYEIYMEDPDGDNLLELEVDFYGDGEEIFRPVPPEPGWPSGSTEIVTHTWDEQGEYTIKARVLDEDGAWSDWGTLSVTMPRNRAMQTPFLNFLEQYPMLYQLLQRVLRL